MTASDLFGLQGKVALVTGGNAGLGLGFASGIAKCGGDVVIWGRRADENESAAEVLRGLGATRVLAQRVDVSSEAQVIAAMAEAVAAMGRVDCVVSNAGIATQSLFHEMSTETYRGLLDINLDGAFFTLREGIRHMVARAEAGDPGGSVIICGSLAVSSCVPGISHYAAAKGALASMMKGICVEYGPIGVRANMVMPGYLHTALYGGYSEAELPMDRYLRERNPIRGWGYPADVEGIGAYLMSDASRYHTGDLIVIDGGLSALTNGYDLDELVVDETGVQVSDR